jgi:hypothetical protein
MNVHTLEQPAAESLDEAFDSSASVEDLVPAADEHARNSSDTRR